MKWTEFDPATGRIRQAIWGVQLTQPQATATLGLLEDVLVDGSVAYVDSLGQIATRPVSSIALSQAGAVISLTGVQVETVINVAGAAAESITQDSASGELEITFVDPGQYAIAAEQFPELPFSASVTVE